MMFAHHKRGFTTVELMISIAIFVLMSQALIHMYKGFYVVFSVQQARIAVNGSAREVVQDFKQTALQASHIVNSRTFSGTTYTTGAGTAVLELPSIDSSGDVLPGVYDYVVFYATSSRAYKITEGAAGSARGNTIRHLSDTINTLTFTYNNADVTQATSTQIEVMTQSITLGQTIQARAREMVRIRNI